MRRSIYTCIFTLIGVWVSGCTGETVAIGVDKAGDIKEWFQRPTGGSTNITDSTESDSELDTELSVGFAGGNGTNLNPYVDSVYINGSELVPIPETETSKLRVDPDFLFSTSRSIRLKVELASAVGATASLVLCTNYEEADSGFIVDYDSCPVRGVLIDGEFESDFSLVNHLNSAIAVVWFPYQESEPMYRTFRVSEDSNNTVLNEWFWD